MKPVTNALTGLLALAVCAVQGCASYEPTIYAPVRLPTGAQDQDPCIVVWEFPGSAVITRGGLEFAVWSDGSFLARASRSDLDDRIVVGQVYAADVTAAVDDIRAAGFFGPWQDQTRQCGGFKMIYVRSGHESMCNAWMEDLCPFLGSVTYDSEYRRFVQMWRRTRGIIDSLSPLSSEYLASVVGENGVFRGYCVNEPWDTQWIPRCWLDERNK